MNFPLLRVNVQMYRLRLYSLGVLLLVSIKIIGQTVAINLSPERMRVSPKGYFIVEVIDERSIKNQIGKLIAEPQPTTLTLMGGIARNIQNYLDKSFNPTKTDSLRAVMLIVKDLKINEKAISANKIQGEIKMTLAFEIYQEAQRKLLTSATAGAGYTRSNIGVEEMIENMLKKMLENQLKGFNSWFSESAKSSPLLAKAVKLTLKEEALTESANGDTVYYQSNRPLNWQDFLGAPNVLSRWAAQIFTSFGFEMRSIPRNEIMEVEVSTKVWIDKTISWVRPNSKNDYVLDHEQLHFDITRLVAERFKHKLRSMPLSVEDFSSEIQYQYLEFFKQQADMQIQYDEESQHGLNQAAQARWVKQVRDELRRMGITPPRP